MWPHLLVMYFSFHILDCEGFTSKVRSPLQNFSIRILPKIPAGKFHSHGFIVLPMRIFNSDLLQCIQYCTVLNCYQSFKEWKNNAETAEILTHF